MHNELVTINGLAGRQPRCATFIARRTSVHGPLSHLRVLSPVTDCLSGYRLDSPDGQQAAGGAQRDRRHQLALAGVIPAPPALPSRIPPRPEKSVRGYRGAALGAGRLVARHGGQGPAFTPSEVAVTC